MAYMNGDEVLFSPQVYMNGTNIVVDTEMSDTSENPVQNKVVKEYVDSSLGGATAIVTEALTGITQRQDATEQTMQQAIQQITEVAQDGFGELHALQDFVGNPIDLNLVTNGYFADGLTGWSKINQEDHNGYYAIKNGDGQPSLVAQGYVWKPREEDDTSPLYQIVPVTPNKTYRVTVRMYGGGYGADLVCTKFVVAESANITLGLNMLKDALMINGEDSLSGTTTRILCKKFQEPALAADDIVHTFEITPTKEEIIVALVNLHPADAGFSDITVTEIGRTITQDIYELKQMAVQIKKLLNIE